LVGKAVNLPSWRRVTINITHIASGHIRGGSRVSAGKTLFPDSMNAQQVEKAVREAYRFGARVRTQGERALVQGMTKAGLKIEMWVNTVSKTIESAYPIP
jgi:hypothetical protein